MYIPYRKIRIQRRKLSKYMLKNQYQIAALIGFIGGIIIVYTFFSNFSVEFTDVKAIPNAAEVMVEQPEQIAEVIVEPEPNHVTGTASYYSREGCIGCSENLTMANGETLDDTAQTVALTPELVSKYKLLNDIVTIENLHTGDKTYAKVTDTGGFARYNRVADLSVATKEALNCSSLCEVKVVFN